MPVIVKNFIVWIFLNIPIINNNTWNDLNINGFEIMTFVDRTTIKYASLF